MSGMSLAAMKSLKEVVKWKAEYFHPTSRTFLGAA